MLRTTKFIQQVMEAIGGTLVKKGKFFFFFEKLFWQWHHEWVGGMVDKERIGAKRGSYRE